MRNWSGRCSVTSNDRVVWSFVPVGNTTSFQTSTLTQKPFASARYLQAEWKMRSASGSIAVPAATGRGRNNRTRERTDAPPVNFRLLVFIVVFLYQLVAAKSVMGGLGLDLADAFVGDCMPVPLDQSRTVPTFGTHERFDV